MDIEAEKSLEIALRISQILERFNITHAIVGGVAISVLVEPRATKDIDFVVKEDLMDDVLRGVRNNLRRIGWRFEGTNTDYYFKRILFSRSPLGEEIKNYIEVWVSGVCNTLKFDSELWRDIKVINGLPIPRVEDLLATKMLLERSSVDVVYHAKSQDMIDVYNLVVKYNRPQLDWQHIRKRLTQWGKSPEMALKELKMIKDKNKKHPNFNLQKIRKAMNM